MLDSFIIEELKRREQQERNRAGHDRPRLELPVDDRTPPRGQPAHSHEEPEEDEKKRGVIVIDI
jgi:hypothetical protein